MRVFVLSVRARLPHPEPFFAIPETAIDGYSWVSAAFLADSYLFSLPHLQWHFKAEERCGLPGLYRGDLPSGGVRFSLR